MRTEYGTTGSAVFSGLDEYINTGWSERSIPYGGWPETATDTWKCDYCGTSHWVKKEELQCKQCGAPRDI